MHSRTVWVLLGVLLLVGACNRAPSTLRVHRTAPLPRGEVRYVAVLPLVAGPELDVTPFEHGREVQPEPATATVHRALREAMQILPGWELTDEIVVGEAIRKLHGSIRPLGGDEAVAVGRLLGVDAVVYGIVRHYEGRVGSDYAARQGALVDFAVAVALFPAGETVWEAEYAERQEPLSDNLWNLGRFWRARGRWLRAGELAAIGARETASAMHHVLYGGAATPVPPPQQ